MPTEREYLSQIHALVHQSEQVTPVPVPVPVPTPGAWVTVAPPKPPSTYTVPAGAVSVGTTTELIAAMSQTARPIVLRDGLYDYSAYLNNGNGHQLYAATLGKAVLKMGVLFGGNFGVGGGLVQGLAFDVSDPNKTYKSNAGTGPEGRGILHAWGKAAGTKVLDCMLKGHSVVGYGFLGAPEGLALQRTVIDGFLSDGARVDANAPAGTRLVNGPLVTDLDISNVSRVVPKSAGGTSESGLWIGINSKVQRIRTRNTAWMGIIPVGNASDTPFTDIDIDGTPVGFYIEHFWKKGLLERFSIGPNVKDGIVSEWNDPAWGGLPGGEDNTIRSGVIDSTRVGAYLDAGTARTSISAIRFRNQCWAAIADNQGNGNVIGVNEYALKPGAKELIRDVNLNTVNCG